MIAAILRAQFLSMRMGRNRGAVFGLISAALWYGLWSLAAAAAYGMGARAGAAELRAGLPVALLLVWLYWQAAPILSASMGSALDLRKLLIYPAPRGKLFAVEVLLRAATALEMLLVLGGGAAGLVRNPDFQWAGFPRLAGALLLFIVFNLFLASGLRSLLERLLTRKVRELVAFLIPMLFVAPRLVIASGIRPKAPGGWPAALQTLALPWTAAARAVLGESEALAFVSLCGWVLAVAWFGRAQFERNLRFDSAAAQSTSLAPGAAKHRDLAERFFRAPAVLLQDPLAGIVEKELRSLARAPRYRMVFVMGFTFGPMVWLPMMIGRGARPGPVASYFLPLLCVYALTLLGQVSYSNCFGFDRSAAQIYFLAPQRISSVLIGKNLAALVYAYLETAILMAGAAALRVAGTLGNVLETLAVVGVCSLYMFAIGNISSVQYPRGLSPERVSRGGSGGRFHALLFLIYPLALLPVFLAYVARYAFDSQAAFLAVLSLAAAGGGLLYSAALDSAANAAVKRREEIVRELSKGEGPVASN